MKLLIDANLSPDIAGAFTRAGGRSEIVHMRDWQGGIYVNQHGQGDQPWLRVAGREGWVVVHNDLNTLLNDIAELSREGEATPGFAVVGNARQPDVGWIARKLVALEKQRGREKNAANIQVYLRGD